MKIKEGYEKNCINQIILSFNEISCKEGLYEELIEDKPNAIPRIIIVLCSSPVNIIIVYEREKKLLVGLAGDWSRTRFTPYTKELHLIF